MGGLPLEGERMKFEFIREQRAEFSVRRLCRHVEVSPAGYYAWAKRPESKRSQEDRVLGVEVAAIFNEHKTRYGATRVEKEMHARGRSLGRKRVARLMRQRGL